MNYDYICEKVAQIKQKYVTKDLDQLCEAMNVLLLNQETPLSIEQFKGLFLVSSRIKVIVLNSKLSPVYRRVVLSHEIGHSVLHDHLASARPFQDFDLFGMKDQCEFEANVFAAELLLKDSEVLSVLNDDTTFFSAAQSLNVPQELLDFKFRIMKHKGYSIMPQYVANADFLKQMRGDEHE